MFDKSVYLSNIVLYLGLIPSHHSVESSQAVPNTELVNCVVMLVRVIIGGQRCSDSLGMPAYDLVGQSLVFIWIDNERLLIITPSLVETLFLRYHRPPGTLDPIPQDPHELNYRISHIMRSCHPKPCLITDPAYHSAGCGGIQPQRCAPRPVQLCSDGPHAWQPSGRHGPRP